MGNGVVGLHFTGKQVLAAVRIREILYAHIEHHIHRLSCRRRGEAQQRADDLPHASIVVIHIGPGLIEVIILRQNRLRVHHRGVIVNEALEINIQLLCNIVQGLNINGNGPVFVF